MKHLQFVGLIALTATALMSLVGSASATIVTSPSGTTYTGEIKAESEGHVSLHNPIASISCSWSLTGSVESHGSGQTVKVPLSSVATTGCTNSWHYTTVSSGSLEIHWTSGSNGTVTWSGMTTESTRFGVTCRYRTENTHLGTITGASPATLHIEAAIPSHGGSGLCGEGPSAFTGSLKISTPSSLFVDSEGEKEPSGTSITSPTGTAATPTILAESEGNSVLDNPIAKIECHTTFEGKIEKHGSGAASGALNGVAFDFCKNSWHVTTTSPGSIEVEWTSGYNGTLKSTGMTLEATRFGVTCRYATSGTKVGTITGGTPATVDIESSVSFHSGSSLCGEGATAWTGSFKLTKPESLFVDG